jgi:CRISPR-associated helicase Cas3
MSGTTKRTQVSIDPVKFRFADEQPHSVGSIELFPHQASFFDALTDQIIGDAPAMFSFLQSMTGSGKTIANILPAVECGKNAMAIYPTNALIRDQLHSIRRDAERFEFADRLSCERLDARRLQAVSLERGRSIPDLLFNEYFGDPAMDPNKAYIYLTTPDTLYNILIGRYWQNEEFSQPMDRARARLLGAFSYFVFDEFHIYSITESTSLLNLSALLHRNEALSQPIVFSSATEDETIKQRLTELANAPVEVFEDSMARSESGDMTIAGPLNLEIRYGRKWNGPRAFQRDFENYIKDAVDRNREITAVFESVKRTLNLLQILEDTHAPDSLAYETGVASNDLEISDPDAHLKIGTRTLSVGIDFSTDWLFLESYRARDFLQKLGRVGRSGEPATAVCHTSEYACPELDELRSHYEDRNAFEDDLFEVMVHRTDVWDFAYCYGPAELRQMASEFNLWIEDIDEIQKTLYGAGEKRGEEYEQHLLAFRDPGRPQVAVGSANGINFQDLVDFLETHDPDLSTIVDSDVFTAQFTEIAPVASKYIEKDTITPVLCVTEEPPQVSGNDVWFRTERRPISKTGLLSYPQDTSFRLQIDGDGISRRLIDYLQDKLVSQEMLLYLLPSDRYKSVQSEMPHLFRVGDLEDSIGGEYSVAFGQNALVLSALLD